MGVGEGIAGFSLSLPDMPVLLPVSVFLLPASALEFVGFAGVEHVDPHNQRAMVPTGWKMCCAVSVWSRTADHTSMKHAEHRE
ncbi:hypothetical protein [Streptomyces sp. NPDC001480]|uniref:hypothetical protein n=1 Tax=Streptomyces sp. NPDC001480 TaxID=3364577 RepID=UPI0036C4A13C